jgi:hypothetical protein
MRRIIRGAMAMPLTIGDGFSARCSMPGTGRDKGMGRGALLYIFHFTSTIWI